MGDFLWHCLNHIAEWLQVIERSNNTRIQWDSQWRLNLLGGFMWTWRAAGKPIRFFWLGENHGTNEQTMVDFPMAWRLSFLLELQQPSTRWIGRQQIYRLSLVNQEFAKWNIQQFFWGWSTCQWSMDLQGDTLSLLTTIPKLLGEKHKRCQDASWWPSTGLLKPRTCFPSFLSQIPFEVSCYNHCGIQLVALNNNCIESVDLLPINMGGCSTGHVSSRLNPPGGSLPGLLPWTADGWNWGMGKQGMALILPGESPGLFSRAFFIGKISGKMMECHLIEPSRMMEFMDVRRNEDDELLIWTIEGSFWHEVSVMIDQWIFCKGTTAWFSDKTMWEDWETVVDDVGRYDFTWF